MSIDATESPAHSELSSCSSGTEASDLDPLSLSRTHTQASDTCPDKLDLAPTAIQRQERRKGAGKPNKTVHFDPSCHDNEHAHDREHSDPNSIYNPRIMITVPIRIPPEQPEPPSTHKHKRSPRAWLQRLASAGKVPKDDLRVVQMTRSDYLKYWARDDQGRYIGKAPQEEGPRIWREKLGLNRTPPSSVPSSANSSRSSSPVRRPTMPERSHSTP